MFDDDSELHPSPAEDEFECETTPIEESVDSSPPSSEEELPDDFSDGDEEEPGEKPWSSGLAPKTPRSVVKPDISHLKDAVESIDGIRVPAVGRGEMVVIDYSGLEFGPYLDTRCWRVIDVKLNGDLSLYDNHRQQYGTSNLYEAPKKGVIIKILPRDQKWTSVLNGTSRKSAARAIARAIKADKKVHDTAIAVSSGAKKGRGRPKGTLNAKTKQRLVDLGHDPAALSKEQIDEIISKWRHDEYERMKAEKATARALKKSN